MTGLVASDIAVSLGGKAILEGIDITFAPGEVTAVVGPNGAGKSTLLACLAGLRRPDRGRATLDGADVQDLAARARARRVAFMAQIPEIAWPIEARTLVGLGRTPWLGARGLTPQDWAAVDKAMDQAGVSHFADRLVDTLSGGERARVLIARALAGEPDWLLADEPLAGLDLGHQLDAAALFRRLAQQGHGVVVTLHDLTLAARMADRIVVLADGRVLAQGSPQEALASDVLARAYGVEARLVDGAGGPMVEIVGRGA